MKTINYIRAEKLIHITSDNLYNNPGAVMDALDKDISLIIDTEAPITLNTLKARMREVFDVAKISGKALDIIMDRISKLGFKYNEELYDLVLWPKTGEFKVDYLRTGSDRLIYDIPPVELKNLVKELNLNGEELYRAILKYFGLEVLTKKANDYLAYVEKY